MVISQLLKGELLMMELLTVEAVQGVLVEFCQGSIQPQVRFRLLFVEAEDVEDG